MIIGFYIANVFLILYFSSQTVFSFEQLRSIYFVNTEQNALANEPINFYFVNIGQQKSKSISIENSGTTSYLIEKVTLQEGGFGVFTLYTNPAVPVYIFPNQIINITLNFLPNRINSFYDTILIFFSEPFRFVYAIPIEGHSKCLNQLFVLDTFGFVGTPDFRVPILLRGDQNLVEPISVNLSFTITVNGKVFFIDSVEQNTSIIKKDVNQTYLTYKINVPNLTFDSATKQITYLIGRLFLSEQDTTQVTLSEIVCETQGVNFEATNAKINTLGICNPNLSLIDFIPNYVQIVIPNQVVDDELIIEFFSTKSTKEEVDIRVYNLIGKLVFQASTIIEPKIHLPLKAIPSGLYKIVLFLQNQNYSEIISVVK